MKEQHDILKESLSAIMDSESDDLELRRVLGTLAQDDDKAESLRSTWHRYHQLRSVISNETGFNCSENFLSGIRDAIAEDELPAREIVQMDKAAPNNWLPAFGQGAIAASVAAAVLVFSFSSGVDSSNNNDPVSTPVASAGQTQAQASSQMVAGAASGEFSQRANISGKLDDVAVDRLSQAVYKEFEEAESLQIPVSFSLDEN